MTFPSDWTLPPVVVDPPKRTSPLDTILPVTSLDPDTLTEPFAKISPITLEPPPVILTELLERTLPYNFVPPRETFTLEPSLEITPMFAKLLFEFSPP